MDIHITGFVTKTSGLYQVSQCKKKSTAGLLIQNQNSQVQVPDRIFCSLGNVMFKFVACGYGSRNYNYKLKEEVAVAATLVFSHN